MAVKRRAKAYSKRKPITNCRKSKKTQFSYVKQVPTQKIVKFNMGDVNGYRLGKYTIKMGIYTEEPIQIRDLSLEAVRQSLIKDMAVIFQKSFFLRCNVYPHNILRNNRVYSGGSKGERIQTGMSKSFGSPEGRAATLRKHDAIFTAYFNGEESIPKVRASFSKCNSKLPCKTRTVTEILNRPANTHTS
ncbi:MAG: 50S ribosomal protein L16 [Candidatus Pacearchaeota archaeon]|jgi:ribosomal protein L16/L10AE